MMTTSGNMLLPNHFSSSSQQLPHVLCNDEEVIKHVVAHPNLMFEIVRRFRQIRASNTREPMQQQHPVTTMDVVYYPSTLPAATSQSNTTNAMQVKPID